jgi:Fe-S cluster assembly ATPase SufC
MSIFSVAGSGRSGLRSILWGAAHALDLGGVLLAEKDWGGLEADAKALRGDWLVALNHAEESLHASEAGEKE